MSRLWTMLLALCWCLPLLAAQTDYAKRIAPLIDPAKLATLGPRQANQRVQKAVYWLAEARQAGQKPDRVLDAALRSVGMTAGAAKAGACSACGRSIDQVGPKVGSLPRLDLPAPLVQPPFFHLPKLPAKLEVLQHHVAFTFLQQVFGQAHIGAETIHLR